MAADSGDVGDVVESRVNDINPIYYLQMLESGLVLLQQFCATHAAIKSQRIWKFMNQMTS